MRAFVKLRHYVLSQFDAGSHIASIKGQITELRKLLMLHIENSENKFSEHDETINQIIIALNNLMEQPPRSKVIGFRS